MLCSNVFTKVMKPVMLYLRMVGFLSIVHIDDFLLMTKSFEDGLENFQKTRYILEVLGFLVNLDKSNLIPVQRRKFLGLIFDSTKICIELLLDQQTCILNHVIKFKKLKSCKIKEFLEFIGRLTFATNAIKYVPVYTQNFERKKFSF